MIPLLVPLGGTVPLDAPSYVYASDLPTPANKQVARRWSYRGMLRSVMLRSGVICKVRDPFDKHLGDDELGGLLSETGERGIVSPSSYASLFHECFNPPRVRRSIQHMFSGAVPGGWHLQVLPDAATHCTDPLWQYDVNSAYLWSVMQGLPDPDSMVIVKRYSGPGVYWVRSPVETFLPYPWNRLGVFPASSDEIEVYGLRSFVVGKGVAFAPNSWDGLPKINRAIEQWSCAKVISRSFWGRWGSHVGPVQETFDRQGEKRTERELPPLWRLPTWAVLITSRLRLRLWDECDKGGVKIVLTDSVVTSRPLTTSPELGGWREVAHYSHGGILTPFGVKPFTPYH